MRSDWLSGASLAGVFAARSHVYAFSCGVYPLIKRSEAASSNKHVAVTIAPSEHDACNCWLSVQLFPTRVLRLSFTATSVLSGLTFDPSRHPTLTVPLLRHNGKTPVGNWSHQGLAVASVANRASWAAACGPRAPRDLHPALGSEPERSGSAVVSRCDSWKPEPQRVDCWPQWRLVWVLIQRCCPTSRVPTDRSGHIVSTLRETIKI